MDETMQQENKYKSFLLKFAYWAAILLVVIVVVKYLLGPLTPFIIALIISALLQPLVRKLSALLKLKSSLVAIVLVVLTYLLLAGILVLLVIGIISAVISWASGLPELFTNTISPWVSRTSGELTMLITQLDPDMSSSVSTMLQNAVSSLGGTVMDFSVNIVSWASSVGTKLPGTLLALVICIIATLFFAGDYEKVMAAVNGVLPKRARDILSLAKKALHTIMSNYARSYALILLLTFTEIAIGLFIIGVENALIIALVIALFDILPVVGSGMVLLPWTIVKFIQGDIGVGIGLAVLYVVVIIVRQIAEPRIVGKQVGLHPLLTLLCMWMGLRVIGGVGMFALPISILILMNLKENGIVFSGRGEKKAAPAQEEQNEVL